MSSSKSLYSPIIVFGFNRPDTLRLSLQALVKNHESAQSDLYICIDGPRNQYDKALIDECEKIAKAQDGFLSVTVTRRKENIGLALSVIDKVSDVLNYHESVIVVEDDILVSPIFLRFMNDSLSFYKDFKDVISVGSHLYPIRIHKKYSEKTFYSRRTTSKGWATWSNRWCNVDFNINNFLRNYGKDFVYEQLRQVGDDLPVMFELQKNAKINSWAIRFLAHAAIFNLYTVYPVRNLSIDIGYSAGTHSDDGLPHSTKYFETLPTAPYAIIYDDCFDRRTKRYLRIYFLKTKVRQLIMKLSRNLYAKL